MTLAPSALAAKKYQQVGSLPQGFSFLLAESVAVNDKNHHIYVADSGRGEVFDFTSATDKSPKSWNGSNAPKGSFGGGYLSVAADNTTGDVYVADREQAVIDKFGENGNLITSFGDSEPSANGQLAGLKTPNKSFRPPTGGYSSFGIAVDQATQDLYVLDAQHKVIDIFSQSGEYLRQITATPTNLYREGGQYAVGIAVNSNGNVYVADWGGPNLLFQFNSSGNYVSTWNGGSLPNGASSETPQGEFYAGTCNGCVLVSDATEDGTGKVFVGDEANGGVVDAFDESGNYLAPQITGSGGSTSGLSVDQETGELYVSNYGGVAIFKLVVVPNVTTGATTNLTSTAGKLVGHVDPASGEGGGPITTCEFEVTSNTGSEKVPCEPKSLPYNSPTEVTGEATGLSPGTEYQESLTVGNAAGTSTATTRFATVGAYIFSTDLGTAGSGDEQFNEPHAVALENNTGDLYVADTGNDRIVKLDSSGHFLAAWGWGVKDGSAESEICTSGCRAGIPGFAAGEFEVPDFVAVDNSNGPSAGDVYVAEPGHNEIEEVAVGATGGTYTLTVEGQTTVPLAFNAGEGELVTALTSLSTVGSENIKIAGGSGKPYTVEFIGSRAYRQYHLTANGSHLTGGTSTVTVSALDEGQLPRVQKFTPSGNLITSWGTNGAETFSQGIAGIAVNRSGELIVPSGPPTGIALDSFGNVYYGSVAVDTTTNNVYEGNGSAIYRRLTMSSGCNPSEPYSPCPPEAFGFNDLNSAKGMAISLTTKALYVANTGSNDIAVFNLVPVPKISTSSPSSVDLTSATLSGSVTPEGAGKVTACNFEYGRNMGYGTSVPCSPTVSPSGTTTVSATLSNLLPFQNYHFRLTVTAENDFGLVTHTEDRSFTTTSGLSPEIDGTSFSELTSTGATLNAQVNPNLMPTTYRFQYGTTESYGSQTLPSESIGEDGADHLVSTVLSGLQPATTYHFRVFTVNFNGTAVGPDRSFTTPAAPTVTENPASNVTQTSATVSAHIRPGFRATTYHVEYGRTSSYTVSTPESPSIGSDDGVYAVSTTLPNLAPETTYHFRIVAKNEVGATEGQDLTFTTANVPAEVPRKEVSATGVSCRKGFVKKKGKCVKSKHSAHRSHKRDANHG